MFNEFEKRLFSSAILIPITFFFIIQGSFLFIIFLSSIFLLTSYEWFKMIKKNNLLKILGITFLLFSFYAAFKFREDNNFKDFLFIITICIFTDLGGYIFGKLFKGPKLTIISPNKTYSGMIGSYVLSLVTIFLFFKNNLSIEIIIFITIVVSSFSQIGDIFISYLKRKAKMKDTGKFLPGHGGLLDRIDGIYFALPFGWLILNL